MGPGQLCGERAALLSRAGHCAWPRRLTDCLIVLGTLSSSSQKTLHTVVLVFLVLSLLTSLLSAGLTLYNSISNPYQTFLGPSGVYTWSGLCGE